MFCLFSLLFILTRRQHCPVAKSPEFQLGYPGFKSPSCNLPCVFSIVPICYSLHTRLWPAGLLSDSGLSLLRFFKYLPLYTSLLLMLGNFVCESSHFQTRLLAFNEFRLHANIKSFSCQWLPTQVRLETEAWGNLEMTNLCRLYISIFFVIAFFCYT